MEPGNVSLKKVGSQDSRMKKEQAAESWEKMAALQRDRHRLRSAGLAPKPQGGQRPRETQACWLCGQSVPGTHRVPQSPLPRMATPRRLAHQTEGFRKSCLQGALGCLATGRPCARTPKARMRSGGSKRSHVNAKDGCS